MYVTRPLSRYLDNPDAAAEPPPEGPGSGFLVVEDEAAVEQEATVCCGLCRDPQVHTLPFPQSRRLDVGEDDVVVFVPVVGEPLSAGRYYVVQSTGHHAGKVLACSREEDKTRVLFFSFVDDAPPRPFHHGDIYQQVEVVAQATHLRGFKAVAVAADGVPPSLLRRKGWQVSKTMRTSSYDLADDAHGMDWQLRRRMPDLDGFGVGARGSPPSVVVVGRWYCPFMFIRDGERRLKDQVKRCMFYEMTLEQSWEEIYTFDNAYRSRSTSSTNNEVAVSATVRRSTALLGGTDAVQEVSPQVVDGVMWFRPAAATNSGAAAGVGLDMVVWEKMKWELERGGWVAGNGDVESIERVERREGPGQWDKIGCYLLLESFVLRRMDGSVALTCGFRHASKIRTKWDNPDAAAEPPPEGPGSGILVVEDEAAVERATRWWGLWVDREVYGLPFPQSRKLKVEYTTSRNHRTHTDRDDVVFVPVVGQPLSSGRYYAVRATGRHAGKVSACSTEEDMVTCCLRSFANDAPPRPFDRGDVYQQVEMLQLSRRRGGFRAVAVAPDGVPPGYLRRKGWKVHTSASTSYNLTDTAHGTDWSLRRQMPDLDSFDVGVGGSPPTVVVGRWYCPFIFIKDSGEQLKDQAKRCMFYKMTLEQSWEEIYTCENTHRGSISSRPDEVEVSVTVRRSTALLGGTDAAQEDVVDGVMWFRRPAASSAAAAGGGLGLDMVVWEKMEWELEKGGWVAGNGDVERIKRVERRDGLEQWDKFGCYLLVERFVLTRMDGTVALTYEFRHTNKVTTRWK
uniref:Uncharacterized protein n=1 Tax=Oryza punctata TaxID=4537 RepID=A0A0E0LUY5_ORYPU